MVESQNTTDYYNYKDFYWSNIIITDISRRIVKNYNYGKEASWMNEQMYDCF